MKFHENLIALLRPGRVVAGRAGQSDWRYPANSLQMGAGAYNTGIGKARPAGRCIWYDNRPAGGRTAGHSTAGAGGQAGPCRL